MDPPPANADATTALLQAILLELKQVKANQVLLESKVPTPPPAPYELAIS